MMLEVAKEYVLFSLFVRFSLNFIVLAILVWGIYFPSVRRKEYVFTYVLISNTVFFMTFFLASVKLELGFALGLFAIFGIIRYRTATIPIREMTYLFVLIAIAVINAVALDEYFFPEVVLTNLVFVVVAYMMEKLWMNKGEHRKTIVFEKIELLRPENREALFADLNKRTGLVIRKIEIGHIDFLKDTAILTVYFSSSDAKTVLSDFEVINEEHTEDEY